MRITVTFDPEVVGLLSEEQRRRRASFGEVVNDAIRRGFASRERTEEVAPYRVRAHKTSLQPGVDSVTFNRLA